MRARAAFRSSLVAVVLGLVLVTPAAAIGPWSLAPGETWTELRGGFFSADTYHDQDGDRHTLAGGGLLEQRSLTWSGEMGWKKRLSFLYSVPFVSVSRRLGGGDRTPYPPSATGFGDAHFGFKYRLANGRSAAAIELDWKAPLGYERAPTFWADDAIDVNVANQTIAPKLGDGQQDVSALLHFGSAIGGRSFLQVAGGYTYRFEMPADRIVFAADAGMWFGRLLVAGQYRGHVATEGDNPTRDSDRHLAGPVLLYRVDDKIDVFASSLHTAMANNAPHTDEVFVGLSFKNTRLDRQQGYLGTTRRP